MIILRLDKIVEGMVESIVVEHNKETDKIINRFGDHMTYNESLRYREERSKEIVDKIKNMMNATVGHMTPGYIVDYKTSEVADMEYNKMYIHHFINILNPACYTIKTIAFKEEILG